MRGFLRRDWYLMLPNLRLCGVFLGGLLLLARFVPRRGAFDFADLFVVLFGLSGLQSLFVYDEMNGWNAYAAAIPGGRRSMVDARCLFALVETLLLMVAILLASLLRGESLPLWSAGFYGGALLFTLAATLPICSRYGGNRGRLVSATLTFILMGVLGGLAAGVLRSAREDLAEGMLRADVKGVFSAAALALPLLGLIALALSWRLCRRIMRKKEF